MSGYRHDSEEEQNREQTISKIILVDSTGMLYNESIINEDIHWDLHFLSSLVILSIAASPSSLISLFSPIISQLSPLPHYPAPKRERQMAGQVK